MLNCMRCRRRAPFLDTFVEYAECWRYRLPIARESLTRQPPYNWKSGVHGRVQLQAVKGRSAMSMNTSRRQFLGGLGVGAAAWAGAAPYAASANSRLGPNDTINLGLIGCGARGRGLHIPRFQK